LKDRRQWVWRTLVVSKVRDEKAEIEKFEVEVAVAVVVVEVGVEVEVVKMNE
jgi:hypothetical protein